VPSKIWFGHQMSHVFSSSDINGKESTQSSNRTDCRIPTGRWRPSFYSPPSFYFPPFPPTSSPSNHKTHANAKETSLSPMTFSSSPSWPPSSPVYSAVALKQVVCVNFGCIQSLIPLSLLYSQEECSRFLQCL